MRTSVFLPAGERIRLTPRAARGHDTLDSRPYGGRTCRELYANPCGRKWRAAPRTSLQFSCHVKPKMPRPIPQDPDIRDRCSHFAAGRATFLCRFAGFRSGGRNGTESMGRGPIPERPRESADKWNRGPSFWCEVLREPDLNRRPSGYEPNALPTAPSRIAFHIIGTGDRHQKKRAPAR
jgi:hypothetical protein